MSLFDALMVGVGVIVDDKVNSTDKTDGIVRIRELLVEKKIPLTVFEMPPASEVVRHFSNISFVILDWEYFEGVSGDKVTAEVIIDFLRDLKSACFSPVFLLSHLDVDGIKRILTENNLYSADGDGSNWIFVHSKADLVSDNGARLTQVIQEWLRETSSIYVLKQWQRALSVATRDMFWDFQNIDSRWPTVLWKSFKADGVNPSAEMQALLMRNVEARLAKDDFDENIVSRRRPEATQESIRKVIEAERFLPQSRLIADVPVTGDLFKQDSAGAITYHLNIRAQCDLLREADAILYCIEGKIIDDATVAENFNRGKEQFNDLATGIIIAVLDCGKTIKFDFKNLVTCSWQDMKAARVGRLLPPYITNIQQRYAHYMHRQAIPRTPACIIPIAEPKDVEAKASDKPEPQLIQTAQVTPEPEPVAAPPPASASDKLA